MPKRFRIQSANFPTARVLSVITLLMLCAAPPVMADNAVAADVRQVLASAQPAAAVPLPTGDLERFYAARNFQPVWLEEKSLAENLLKYAVFIESLVTRHGLGVQDYPLDLLQTRADKPDPAELSSTDVLITASFLRFIRDMQGERVNLSRLYGDWPFARPAADPVTVLLDVARTNGLADFAQNTMPRHPHYAKLTGALQAYRGFAAKGGWKPIPPGESLKPGMQESRIPLLRQRLKAEGYLNATEESALYDPQLEAAVRDWQRDHGIEPDGAVGKDTLSAMNVPVGERIDQILANMERWRHMPEHFPARAVFVNIAGAEIVVEDQGKEIYHGPIVVGRPARPTPFIQSAIDSLIINPYWHVPTKIARKDILPKLRKNPNYLEDKGIVIRERADFDPYGHGVNWHAVSESGFSFNLRQTPGEKNSLGRIKFDFPNIYSVYLHGTPEEKLFGKAFRAESSGCVRLRDPQDVAQLLLNDPAWTDERIENAIASGETTRRRLAEPVSLYITYWSVFAGDAERVQFRRDIYGYDRKLADALN